MHPGIVIQGTTKEYLTGCALWDKWTLNLTQEILSLYVCMQACICTSLYSSLEQKCNAVSLFHESSRPEDMMEYILIYMGFFLGIGKKKKSALISTWHMQSTACLCSWGLGLWTCCGKCLSLAIHRGLGAFGWSHYTSPSCELWGTWVLEGFWFDNKFR